jgi:hypothetical protein
MNKKSLEVKLDHGKKQFVMKQSYRTKRMKLGPISFTLEDQDKKNSSWHEFGTKSTLV